MPRRFVEPFSKPWAFKREFYCLVYQNRVYIIKLCEHLHFNIYIGAQHRYRVSLDTVLLPIDNIRFVARAISRLLKVVGYFLSLWSW